MASVTVYSGYYGDWMGSGCLQFGPELLDIRRRPQLLGINTAMALSEGFWIPGVNQGMAFTWLDNTIAG